MSQCMKSSTVYGHAYVAGLLTKLDTTRVAVDQGLKMIVRCKSLGSTRPLGLEVTLSGVRLPTGNLKVTDPRVHTVRFTFKLQDLWKGGRRAVPPVRPNGLGCQAICSSCDYSQTLADNYSLGVESPDAWFCSDQVVDWSAGAAVVLTS